MTRPTVYGPSYSVYTQIVRLALEEKGTPYEIADVAMMSGAHTQPAYLKRNPFGKLPAFAHGTLSLYETGAITRYVDRAFDGPALQPSEPQAMALVDQVISVVISYAYACMIGVLAWQRLIVPMSQGHAGRTRDRGLPAPGEPVPVGVGPSARQVCRLVATPSVSRICTSRR